jgi:adenylate kinase
LRLLCITGTPGTGKKTVAPLVAKALGLSAPLALNSLARKGQTEVDTALLRAKLLKLKPAPGVVYGHLLPHVLRKGDAALVAVLRCEPSLLRARLVSRGYPEAKVNANVEAELIGVVLDECVRRFGETKVREYDTTSLPPKRVAEAIARDAKGPTGRRPPQWIDWTLGYDSSTKLRSLFEGRAEPPAST